MTEAAQLKEHNLRKLDTCVHIEQLVDATYHSNLASATLDATLESEEIFEAGNVPQQPDKLSTVSNLRLVSFEETTGGKSGIPIDAERIPESSLQIDQSIQQHQGYLNRKRASRPRDLRWHDDALN
jgi:hypothetical protein